MSLTILIQAHEKPAPFWIETDEQWIDREVGRWVLGEGTWKEKGGGNEVSMRDKEIFK